MKKILLLSALAFLFVSCDKDDDEETEQAVTQANLVGSYTLGSVKVKYGANPEVDATSLIAACERDDVITLKADNTVNSTDAGVQCSPVNTMTGTWSLSGNVVTINAFTTIEGTVIRLTNKTATIQDNDVQAGTITTFYLNRQ